MVEVKNKQSIWAIKAGQSMPCKFGLCDAQLYCLESVDSGTLFKNFKLMVFGVQVADLVAERRAGGELIFEEC